MKNPLYSFLLISIFGIFISVPFVPPGDAHKMRAFAATIPLMALLPAIGVSELMQIIPWRVFGEKPADADFTTTGLPVFSTLLVSLMVFAPYVA